MNRRQAIKALAIAPLISSLPVLATGSKSSAPIDLSEHIGKIVLVDFWASWCGPCRQSFPWLNEMSAKYSAQGLHIIGVNLDSDVAPAKQFLDDVPAQFEILFDPEGRHASFYNLKAMPTSILFDRTGKVASRHNGFLTDEASDYEARVQSLLGA